MDFFIPITATATFLLEIVPNVSDKLVTGRTLRYSLIKNFEVFSNLRIDNGDSLLEIDDTYIHQFAQNC